MLSRNRLASVFLACFVTAGCQDAREPVAPEPRAAAAAAAAEAGKGVRSEEALSERFARQIPGFGGWYYEGADLVVVVTDPDAPGLLGRARAVVAPTLHARPAGARLRGNGPGSVVLRKGRYTWGQLKEWRDRMTMPVLGIEGVRYTDLDEVRNRLVVGVERAAAVASVRSKFGELGIPLETMQLQPSCEPTGLDCQDPCTVDPAQPGCSSDPCTMDPSDPACDGSGDYCTQNPGDPSCQDPCEANPGDPECQPRSDLVTPDNYESVDGSCTKIINHCRPLRGGLLMNRKTSSGYAENCTVGFIFAYPGNATRFFMTNSHCTASQGQQTSTIFYQPVGSNRSVGIETNDPPYMTQTPSGSGTTCNSSNPCRYSDAAAVRIEEGYISSSGQYHVSAAVSSHFGYLARPRSYVQGPSATNAPVEIDQNNPVLAIIGEYKAKEGDGVHKIGGLTAWTWGAVKTVCVDRKQSSGKIHLCQNTVSYSSLSGDSGGPTFVLQSANGNQVRLTGIHHSTLTQWSWGCFCNKRVGGVYSPLAQVRREMGAFQTYPGGATQGPF